ncbi:MAG: hypothetical protein IPM75_05535 [Candidatus Competibacteraceae bacterium]|nr:hypothetical protein [Candidatus Competibacteraceae bacterium]
MSNSERWWMGTPPRSRLDGDGPRAVRARRLVVALVVLAVAIYFGFILMMAWR